MRKEFSFTKPRTLKEVKEMIKYTNELFNTDLTFNKLEETYWAVCVYSIDEKILYFRGWSQSEQNSDDPIPIWTSIKNDSRIVLFTTEQQAKMYTKVFERSAIVFTYKEEN